MIAKPNDFDFNGQYYSLIKNDISSKTFDSQTVHKVTDVNIVVPDKVVEVTFDDGAKEKSVCNDSDVFSLEIAISICILKKILGGTKNYNVMIKSAIKDYNRKIAKNEKEMIEKELADLRRKKRREYIEKRRKKKEKEEMDKQIEIQKTAFIQAIKELENNSSKNAEYKRDYINSFINNVMKCNTGLK